MKKLYTFAFAAAVALSASAAHTPLSPSVAYQGKQNPSRFVSGLKSLRGQASVSGQLRVKAKTSAEDEWGVIENPAGEKKNYKNNGTGMAYGLFGPYITDYTGLASVVWGDNNEVYINNILLGHSSYVKGTLSDDGKKVTVQLPQNLEVEDLSDYGMGTIVTCLSIGDKYIIPGENGEEDMLQFSPVADEQNVITYTVGDDGTLTGDFDYSFIYDSEQDAYSYPDRLLGLFAFQDTDPDYKLFYEEACWNQSLTPFDKVDNTIPSDVAMDSGWTMADAEGRQFFVSVGFGADKVYIQGITEDFLPGGVVIGDMDDEKISFSRQYVGYSTDYSELIFLLFGVPFQVEDTTTGQLIWDVNFYGDDGELVPNADFIFDKDAKTIKPASDTALLFNVYEDNIDYSILDYYVNPEFAWIDTTKMAAPPANPEYIGFNDYIDMDGSIGIRWKVPAYTVDGTPLHPGNMSWTFYVDNKPYEFAEDIYYLSEYGLPFAESYTVIPLALDTQNIWYAQSELTICVWDYDFTTIGLKVFNKADGKTYESDLVSDEFSGISGVVHEGKTVKSVEYYDLNGRRVAKPAQGICVARTIFTDGTSVTSKKVIR